MEKKLSLILDNEFIEYCKLNNIENIEMLATEIFKRGFTLLKYGNAPAIDMSKVIIKPLPPASQIIKEGQNPKVKPKHQKEDITDTQTGSNAVVPLLPKSVPQSPKKDLYDE